MNELISNPFGGQMQTTNTGLGLAQSDQQRAIAEVQAAMMIARMNPRDPVKAVDKILNACTRQSLAETGLYQYSRGGSSVSGASIRLAETMAQCWGNIDYGFREITRSIGSDGITYSEIESFAWDLETNTRRHIQFRVRHWRDTKQGSYAIKDERDIYELTANMAQRRVRACILGVIPGDVEEAARNQCEVTLKTKADTSPEAMKKMIEAFEEFGVSKSHIEKRIQCRLEAIKPAQVVSLKKIYVSLRDGMSSKEDWFDDVPEDPRQEPKTLPEMSQEEFSKNLNAWEKMLQSGKKTPDDIIKMLSSKHTLTEAQKKVIEGLVSVSAPEQEVGQ